MLSVEDNEILTHVGPGTIMGDLLRQYWVPALLSEEVPQPDCPPVRLRLLGENLIGFRVTSGKVALIQDACPHRRASFFFGRNEEEGIRCAYHGWKFDVAGNCVDQLNEPEGYKFESKVHAVTYPCVDRGGLVWAYMGPRTEDLPPLPDLEPNMMVEGRGRVSPNMFNWNWFQCMENNMDTSHQGILHFGAVPLEDALDPEKAQQAYAGPVEDLKYIVGNRATTFIVKDTDFGCSYGAYRPGEEATNYFRTMHWLFPWVTMTPVIKLGTSANCVITVPLDDTHTMSWNMTTGRLDQPASAPARQGGRDLLPNTADFLGRFRLKFFYDTAASGDYDFGVDREEQKTGRTVTGYTGMPSVIVQDSAITWSQGTIVDRSQEALGSTDAMIIRVRRRLLAAAKELRERGTIPPGVDQPEIYRQRSGWALVPTSEDFWEYLRPKREAFQKAELTPSANGRVAAHGHLPAREVEAEKQPV